MIHVERAEQVDVDDLAPEIGRRVEEVFGAIPSGVVDEERHRPEDDSKSLDRARHGIVIRDIDGVQACPAAAGLDFARHGLARRGVEVEDADGAAFLRQPARDRRADAVGPAGHQDGAILQSTHRLLRDCAVYYTSS